MPAGLETQVGEAGLGLSGGQAQRLSLARAVLADRPLLLLDEPTSQVDLASEAAIVESIEQLAQGRTVSPISHREGALVNADRIVRVAARGIHEAGTAKVPAGTGDADDAHEGGTSDGAATAQSGEARS